METAYHYSPDLMQLLVDTIPLLCPRKKDVLSFFKGAGVPANLLQDISDQVRKQPESIGKHEITRIVIERINEGQDSTLRDCHVIIVPVEAKA